MFEVIHKTTLNQEIQITSGFGILISPGAKHFD